MEAVVETADMEDTKAVAAVVVEDSAVDAVEVTKEEVQVIMPDTIRITTTTALLTILRNSRIFPSKTRRTCRTTVRNILEVMVKLNRATTINLNSKRRNRTRQCSSSSNSLIDNGITLHKMIDIITMR